MTNDSRLLLGQGWGSPQIEKKIFNPACSSSERSTKQARGVLDMDQFGVPLLSKGNTVSHLQ
jgi:hypothetical protein